MVAREIFNWLRQLRRNSLFALNRESREAKQGMNIPGVLPELTGDLDGIDVGYHGRRFRYRAHGQGGRGKVRGRKEDHDWLRDDELMPSCDVEGHPGGQNRKPGLPELFLKSRWRDASWRKTRRRQLTRSGDIVHLDTCEGDRIAGVKRLQRAHDQ
jgi:hypothetical protein